MCVGRTRKSFWVGVVSLFFLFEFSSAHSSFASFSWKVKASFLVEHQGQVQRVNVSYPISLEQILAQLIIDLRYRVQPTRQNDIRQVWDTTAASELQIRWKLAQNLSATDKGAPIFALDEVIFGIVYLERIMARNPSLIVDKFSIFRLFFVAVTQAHKYEDDDNLVNSAYAEIVGASLARYNSLEREFLDLMGFVIPLPGPWRDQNMCSFASVLTGDLRLRLPESECIFEREEIPSGIVQSRDQVASVQESKEQMKEDESTLSSAQVLNPIKLPFQGPLKTQPKARSQNQHQSPLRSKSASYRNLPPIHPRETDKQTPNKNLPLIKTTLKRSDPIDFALFRETLKIQQPAH